MARLSPEDALKKAQQEKKKAEEKIRAASEKLAKKKRTEDTRRKIIIGGIILRRFSEGTLPRLKETVSIELSKMSPRDRELFPDFIPSSPHTEETGEKEAEGK